MRDDKPHYKKKINEEFIPCIVPTAEYEVCLIGWGRCDYKTCVGMMMLYQIETEGRYAGLMLPRYYNLSSWKKTARTPIPAGRSDFATHYRKFHGTPRTKRGYNPEHFANKVYVVTVKQYEKGNDKSRWFTKIDKILREFKE